MDEKDLRILLDILLNAQEVGTLHEILTSTEYNMKYLQLYYITTQYNVGAILSGIKKVKGHDDIVLED